MADSDAAKLALLLQAQSQRQKMLGDSLPQPFDANRPVQEPEQSWLDKLSEAASGFGYGRADNLEALGQMVRHPLDTLHSATVGISKAMDNPAAAGRAVVQGIKEAAGEAVSSPFNLGRAVGANVSLDPRKLATMLDSPMVREMTVYHGTPYQFDKFDASKIGTGEGAQAYGHGLYFAESPDVARNYIPKGNDLNGFTVKETGEFIGKNDPRYSEIANAMDRMIKNGYGERFSEQFLTHGGSLYHVDLPDEMVDRMLDWDKPLSEQSPVTRKALKDAGLTQYVDEMESSYLASLPSAARAIASKMINGPDEQVISHGMGFKGNPIAERNWNQLERLAPGIDHNQINDIRDWYQSKNGADLYAEMSQGAGGRSATTASNKLRELGIPGIKYLDAGSRGAGGSGTRNFVVFPGEEDKLKILERK